MFYICILILKLGVSWAQNQEDALSLAMTHMNLAISFGMTKINKKIIRIKEYIFNGKVMYKDRMGIESRSREAQVEKSPQKLKILGMKTHQEA